MNPVFLNFHFFILYNKNKKGATSRGGVAPFASKDGSIKTIPQITEKDGIRTIDATTIMDEDAFVDGLWEGSRNREGY